VAQLLGGGCFHTDCYIFFSSPSVLFFFFLPSFFLSSLWQKLIHSFIHGESSALLPDEKEKDRRNEEEKKKKTKSNDIFSIFLLQKLSRHLQLVIQ